MKKNTTKKILLGSVIVFLLIITILLFSFAPVTQSVVSFQPFTKYQSSAQTTCVLYLGSRSCQVDSSYCKAYPNKWEREDLDCFRDSEDIGEVCLPYDVAKQSMDSPPAQGRDVVCTHTIIMGYACTDSSSFCMDTYEGGTLDSFDLYCNIENFYYCDAGCVDWKCKEITGCSDPYGNEGDQVCTDNSIYECQNKVWNKLEDCNSFSCKEETATYARCKTDIYFCINNNFNCISSSNNGDNCYTTQKDCEDKIVYWCLSEDTKECTKRTGSCKAGELSYRGTEPDQVKAQCESQICGKLNTVCCDGDKCEDNLVCEDTDEEYVDGTKVKRCVESENDDGCGCWIKMPLSGDCIISDWFCKINNYFLKFRIAFSIIFGLIVGLFSGNIWRNIENEYKFETRKKKWVAITVGIILGAVTSLLAWFYFWAIVIVVILLIIIKLLIKILI